MSRVRFSHSKEWSPEHKNAWVDVKFLCRGVKEFIEEKIRVVSGAG
ncbi:MAG: hypothetical protein HY514_05245 [Candidatus Aenigmarchaeota archaeon]|nr:hypothetical protein [Candidatus Aenigmarchaeota archaeon]